MNREKNLKRINELKNILNTDIECMCVDEHYESYDRLEEAKSFKEKRRIKKTIKAESYMIHSYVNKYFKVKGELRLREIINDCYYGNDELTDDDKLIIQRYFYYSNYALYSKGNYFSHDVATYSGELDSEDVEILKKLYKRFEPEANLDSNELVIAKINEVLSGNIVTDIVSKMFLLEDKVSTCKNPIMKMAMKKRISLYKGRIYAMSEQYSQYLRLHHELDIRFIIRKYNNKEELTREELKCIKSYLQILELQSKYGGFMSEEYELGLNKNEIALLKKIVGVDKK